jgi:hypothetical protein
MKKRQFIAFIKYLGWWNISLGITVDLRAPQIAIHFPMGFAAIGWNYYDPDGPAWEENLIGKG